MNTDIRVKLNFRGHRKRRKLRKLLGPNYLDYLIDIWLSTADEKPDGNISGWDDDDLISIASATVPFKGSAEKLRKALTAAGFLDNTMVLHDWEEHQSWVIDAPGRQAKGKHAATVKKVKREFYKDCPGHYYEDNQEYNHGCNSELCPLKNSELCPFLTTSSTPPPFLLPSYTFPSPFLLPSYSNSNNTPCKSPSRGTIHGGNNGDKVIVIVCQECGYEMEWRGPYNEQQNGIRTSCAKCRKPQIFRMKTEVDICQDTE